MPLPIALTISGANSVHKTMKDLRKTELKIARKVLSQGLRKGGKITLQQAKANVAVRTGALKRGLKLRVAKNSKREYVRYRVFNDPNQFYANFLESGTDFIKARHALRRATNSTRNQVIQIVNNELRANL